VNTRAVDQVRWFETATITFRCQSHPPAISCSPVHLLNRFSAKVENKAVEMI